MRWGHYVVIRIFQIASNNSIKTNDFEYQTLLVNFLLQSDMADEIVTKMRYSFEKRNRLVLIDLLMEGSDDFPLTRLCYQKRNSGEENIYYAVYS